MQSNFWLRRNKFKGIVKQRIRTSMTNAMHFSSNELFHYGTKLMLDIAFDSEESL